MALRPIIRYPSQVLLTPTRPVGEISVEIRALAGDMWETMYDAPGVGLAANQVGQPVRLAVIDVRERVDDPDKGNKLVLVEPVLLEARGMRHEEEGCLSLPGFSERVERPAWVRVKARDLDGREFEVVGEGLLGRALCHEIDHLDGMTFIDRLSALKRDLIKRKIRKLIKNGEWPEPATTGP